MSRTGKLTNLVFEGNLEPPCCNYGARPSLRANCTTCRINALPAQEGSRRDRSWSLMGGLRVNRRR